MEFKITSIKASWRQAGMSMPELMVALAISGLLAAAFFHLSSFTGFSFAAITNYTELDTDSRNAIDRMSQKVRQASGLTSYASNSITLLLTNSQPVRYTHVPSSKTLVEVQNNVTNVLLRNCDSVKFDIFKRNPITNSFNQFPVLTSTNEVKLIQVSWTCSRKLFNGRVNSEDLFSAKIVMRPK